MEAGGCPILESFGDSRWETTNLNRIFLAQNSLTQAHNGIEPTQLSGPEPQTPPYPQFGSENAPARTNYNP
jgi:hypothetical protein